MISETRTFFMSPPCRAMSRSRQHLEPLGRVRASQVERGIISPTLDKLEALAAVLGVPVNVLVRRAER
jgi:transcriptional regulator with XRE-family HTH domain